MPREENTLLELLGVFIGRIIALLRAFIETVCRPRVTR
jgi:hypothetical protein